MKLLLLAAGAAVVAGKCANDCNNHGNCNAKNQCECHRNYFGPDCSSRLCPAGRAFVDSSVGDVDGDNSVGVDLVYAQSRAASPISEMFSYQYSAGRDSFDSTASWNEAHFYQECSNKGVCDTSTGTCACFPGYEGSGCDRKSCENDCSGHGACKNYAGTGYNMWDKQATMYCDCDAGYTGPGCEKRECPSGVDPVEGSNVDPSRMYRIAFRTLSVADGDFDLDTFYKAPFGPVTWTITLTDEFGDEWTTSLLTTNYDVILDSSDEPTHSLPIIAAATVDTAGTMVDSDSEFTVGGGSALPTGWNAFGDGSYHVATQVEAALEALPDGASGAVKVHELYATPAVADAASTLLSEQFPSVFTGLANADYHLEWPILCGAKDIYISGDEANANGAVASLSAESIAGCGVAVIDSVIGAGCTERNGNNDVNDAIEGTGAFYGVPTDMVSDVELQVLYDLQNVVAASIADADSRNAISVDADSATGGGFAMYDQETIYYQYPHFSNADSAADRFPLFEDLEASCSNGDGLYGASPSYFTDAFAFDTDGDTMISSIAGLNVFLYFAEPTVETAPRVDYYFHNEAANAFLIEQIFSPAGTMGEKIQGVNNGAGDYASHSLVRVNDVTGDRSWDVAYHGRRAYFLEDGSDTSNGINVHVCSKRGICDYTTGLCDCFSGFAGDNCANQNALAY